MAGAQEDRSRVAQPDVAEAAGGDLDPLNIAQQPPRGRLRRVAADHQPHALAAGAGQGAGEGRDLGLSRLQVLQPQVGVARESEPHGPMRRPFGGNDLAHGVPIASQRTQVGSPLAKGKRPGFAAI